MSWTPIGALTNDTTLLECDCGALVRDGNETTHECQLRCPAMTPELDPPAQCIHKNNHPPGETDGGHYANTYGPAGEVWW